MLTPMRLFRSLACSANRSTKGLVPFPITPCTVTNMIPFFLKHLPSSPCTMYGMARCKEISPCRFAEKTWWSGTSLEYLFQNSSRLFCIPSSGWPPKSLFKQPRLAKCRTMSLIFITGNSTPSSAVVAKGTQVIGTGMDRLCSINLKFPDQ